jgi:type IV secretory pathway VirB2 component (pilin)
MVVFHPPTQP